MLNVDARRLRAAAAPFSVGLPDDMAAALIDYADLLFAWNRQINLTAIRSADELVDRHFVDAFVASRFVGPGTSVVDVGSGSGLPAIPLALVAPGASIQMFEPTRKKAAFLRTAVRQLGLGARVQVNDRRMALPVPDDLAGRFDVACSKATFSPESWLPIGRALVRFGGRVLVFATAGETLSRESGAEAVAYGRDRRLLVFGKDGAATG